MQLIIEQLTKQYKEKIVVNNLSLKLNNGLYGLLGENGAGKTTLIRMICGVLKANDGSISYNGFDSSTEKYRDKLGYLPQDFGYYPDFSALDFMLYMASVKGLLNKQAKAKSDELLELVSLSKYKNKKIKTFSGGMKQRLGIAQALLNDPKVLILDEPTSGLDPKQRVLFRNLINQIKNDRIIILSTHIVTDVESIADEILMMKNGHIIQQGALSQIIKTIEDKVFEVIVNKKDLEIIEKNYNVIDSKVYNDNLIVKIISDTKPFDEAIKCEATLEDLYLYYFKYIDGESHA